MARTKGSPHRSPSSLGDASRDIPVLLARNAKTPAKQQALLRASAPSEMPIPTDWNSERIKEAKKPRHQRDLEKVQRILRARLDGEMVSADDLTWALEVAEEEDALERAENDTISAAGSLSQEKDWSDIDMWDDSIGGRQRETDKAPLTTDNVNTINARGTVSRKDPLGLNDDESLSSFTTVSVVSDLDPEGSPKQKGKEPSIMQLDGTADEAQDDAATESEAVDPLKPTLARALNTLEYDDNPSDRPQWLTGLRKPLPHPDLTALQDIEIQMRFWVDEIARLQQLRSKLRKPKGAGDGEWHYEHFGSTIEVVKRTGNRSKNVFARGIWRYMVGGERVRQQLDEYPMSVEGEPLGWGARKELGDFEAMERLEEEDGEGA